MSKLCPTNPFALLSCLTAAMLACSAGWAASPEASRQAALARVTGATLNVPQDYESIQEAIDQAKNGDLVLVAPGTYHESLVIDGRSITVASTYLTTGDNSLITGTVLDGTDAEGDEGRMDRIILVGPSAGESAQIIGFTFYHGDDGISCEADIHILHNRFIDNVDAIDYEGGGGVCAYNLFEFNQDDGIDLDGPCQGVFEHNIIRDNQDDGIEIRLHPYTGALRRAIIRHNRIERNGEDGIQFIDYPEPSNREFVIERNIISDSAMAGIGFMSNANTRECYEAADVDERVFIVNNTLLHNHYGITGGNTVIALNNIIAETAMTALLNVDSHSHVANTLFWNNGRDNAGSNLAPGTSVAADPMLGSGAQPMPGSPAVDAGATELVREDCETLSVPPGAWAGSNPDLGAIETGMAAE